MKSDLQSRIEATQYFITFVVLKKEIKKIKR